MKPGTSNGRTICLWRALTGNWCAPLKCQVTDAAATAKQFPFAVSGLCSPTVLRRARTARRAHSYRYLERPLINGWVERPHGQGATGSRSGVLAQTQPCPVLSSGHRRSFCRCSIPNTHVKRPRSSQDQAWDANPACIRGALLFLSPSRSGPVVAGEYQVKQGLLTEERVRGARYKHPSAGTGPPEGSQSFARDLHRALACCIPYGIAQPKPCWRAS